MSRFERNVVWLSKLVVAAIALAALVIIVVSVVARMQGQ
jgi:hypothetical protein